MSLKQKSTIHPGDVENQLDLDPETSQKPKTLVFKLQDPRWKMKCFPEPENLLQKKRVLLQWKRFLLTLNRSGRLWACTGRMKLKIETISALHRTSLKARRCEKSLLGKHDDWNTWWLKTQEHKFLKHKDYSGEAWRLKSFLMECERCSTGSRQASLRRGLL
jgi:hypothetical protein